MSTGSVSVCDVLLQVALGGAPLSVLCGVGQPFPAAGVPLTPHAVRASQLSQAFGRRPLLRVVGHAPVGPVRGRLMEVVAQILQV